MASFTNTISYRISAASAQDASQHAANAVRVGTDHGYFRDAVVVSVEPIAEPIYTQAQADEMIATAVAAATANSNA